MDPGFRYGIYANYMEIYNENVYDLLSEEKKEERTPLAVKEDKNGRVFVKDLVEKSFQNVGVLSFFFLFWMCFFFDITLMW